MATTFSAAMERTPLRAFQIATFVICLLVLTCDGIDQQLLGIIAPKVIEAFDRAGVQLIGEGAASQEGGRGVRLKQARPVGSR